MLFDTLLSLHKRENTTSRAEYCIQSIVQFKCTTLYFTFSSHSLVVTHSSSLCVIICVCVCVCLHRVLLWTVCCLHSGLYVVRTASHWVKLSESNTAKMSLCTGQSHRHALTALHDNGVFNIMQKLTYPKITP